MTAHISDDTLEAFAISKRLPSDAFAAEEEHLLVCERCRERLLHWDVYVDALRSALKSQRDGRSGFVHRTDDGPVLSCAEQQADGTWVARLIGPGLDGGKLCPDEATAEEFLTAAAWQMFPEHRCTSCSMMPEADIDVSHDDESGHGERTRKQSNSRS